VQYRQRVTGRDDARRDAGGTTRGRGTLNAAIRVSGLFSMAYSTEVQMAKSNAHGGPIRKFVDVQKALKGASYPAEKADLLETAKSNGADEDVLNAIEALPEQQYGSPAEVSKGVGEE
jgi:hypothetical protein